MQNKKIEPMYTENGVEYFPCVGYPQSVKTRKQGRKTPLRFLEKPRDANPFYFKDTKRRFGDDKFKSISNAKRILDFKFASKLQKEYATNFLTGKKERVSTFKIKEICITLSKIYKDF